MLDFCALERDNICQLEERFRKRVKDFARGAPW
jgi:hypothetical protein